MTTEYNLTDSAKQALKKNQDVLSNRMINHVLKNKSLPGEKEIEITASDVNNFYKSIYFYNSEDRRYRFYRLLTAMYLFMGIFILLFGLYYDKIMYMLHHNFNQFMIILMGLVTILLSILMAAMYKSRSPKREAENQDQFVNQQNRPLLSSIYKMISPEIASFHNHLLGIMEKNMGSDDYKRILKIYSDNNNDPNSLSHEDVNLYIIAIKPYFEDIVLEIKECLSSFSNASKYLDNYPEYLSVLIDAERVGKSIMTLSINSEKDYVKIIECIEDFDSIIGYLRNKLMDDVGIE